MQRLHHYLSLVVFTLGFIGGVQIPQFVDQYQKRVDARLAEVSEHVGGYQSIADQLYGGDLNALLEKHQQSTDETFRAEAAVIQGLMDNRQRYQQEQTALSRTTWHSVWHIVTAADRRLLLTTYHQYSAGLLFSQSALFMGVIVALLAGVLFECLLGLFSLLIPTKRGIR